ncbi:MBOAT family protein [Porphyromonas sp.]|uniref:MBOAT family O-acyltransferase n=1 Tax=Porphyromonas sp. TaxID=1924944 RepID=UPI0026DC875F|nr:MBOAT family O-acyltransferase [Porphyromonas sp.]MDO4771333.1 MBOAT family O-acyltransferase [Porphyromonas sp.]
MDNILSFFQNIDLSRIPELIRYNPESPMIFSSGLFFLLFIAFFSIYGLLRHATHLRILYVVAFSLFFYYKSSGMYLLLLVFAATSDFIIARFMSHSTTQGRRKLWLFLSMVVNLGILSYFKYFNFLGDLGVNLLHLIGNWTGYEPFMAPEWKVLPIFLPVGISFYTFQTMSYIIDVYRGRITPLNRWIDYLFYVSFFPQLVAGPIVRALDFIPQIHRTPVVTSSDLGRGVFLILTGLIKKALISDYISLNFVDRIFDAPQLYTGFEVLMGVYGYALQIYCDFSGYSDMAIGIALFLGFKFNINFDYPYRSATITEFWRRWHISLSTWLKDYLYIPLGGNRKGKWRTYLNLLITMLLGGLWHGAALRFILWGGIHGLALAVHKLMMQIFPNLKTEGREMKPHWRVLSMIFTFHIVCFSWIFFRANDMAQVQEILSRIVTEFHPELMWEVISGYSMVFGIMLFGYAAHMLPRRALSGLENGITRSPLILKSLYIAIVIFIIFQVKSADVQPFIYFQF